MSTISLRMVFSDITEQEINPAPRLSTLDHSGIMQYCLESEIFGIVSNTQVDNLYLDPNWNFRLIFDLADEMHECMPESYELEEVFFDKDSGLNLVYSRSED